MALPSPFSVTEITALHKERWHKCAMQRVGTISNTLKGSAALCKCLRAVGVAKHIPPRRYLFKTGDSNDGVFLVRKGKVALLVEGLPHLDRVFSVGSVVGLPSTFTGSPYSLTARTLADSEIVHVEREDFLELMRRYSALCREATGMLSRELSFIHAALARREERKQRKGSGYTNAIPVRETAKKGGSKLAATASEANYTPVGTRHKTASRVADNRARIPPTPVSRKLVLRATDGTQKNRLGASRYVVLNLHD